MGRMQIRFLGLLVGVASCFCSILGAQLTTDPVEVDALKAIRKRLVDPLGKLLNWRSGDPCVSNWTGVLCEGTPDGGGHLHVQELQLLNFNLSGTLAPELGLLSHMKILDVMWNTIYGSIPKEIGNITSLTLLLLNGNKLSGPLPDELGNLSNLDRIQVDQNQISGSVPKSFANLKRTRHFHMNNNSLTGQIPSELSQLSSAVHILLDNNNLSGHLPPEFSNLPKLEILQLDNNNFSGSSIPASYANISTLQKLSLRNCSLQGTVPDLSAVPQLLYLDLSRNILEGPIPSSKLSNNITTIDLSNNFLNGSIPVNFSLPNLQLLSLENNLLNGSVPSYIWQTMTFSGNESLILNFQNNSLSDILVDINTPATVRLLLYGNPVCLNNPNRTNIQQLCHPQIITLESSGPSDEANCGACPTDMGYEHNPLSSLSCFCAVPVGVGFRLKSPSFSDFLPYAQDFEIFLTSHLHISLNQLYINSFAWEEGPRLRMYLKLFPDRASLFNTSEILRIRGILTGWHITFPGLFGPYELLNITLGSYENANRSGTSGLSKGVVSGIVVGSVIGAAILSALFTFIVMRKRRPYKAIRRRHSMSRNSIKIDGVKGFTYKELASSTNNFSSSMKVGQGGYGNVYKGILSDATLVAIKRAHAGSLQGSKEFFTEIELLSRLHHRNLVSLTGYCNEGDEQMLVYEFMPNGTLRDHLSAKSKEALSFSMRLRIALGAARGVLYLHTEADPPIFHRDIKASNILLDSKFVAKVADFGLSRLAPVPDMEGSNPDHVSTVVKGTPGYLDPEYFLTHQLSDKSDVYSLGVVFLELLSGMQPIAHGKNIVREVSMAYRTGSKVSVIDNRMGMYPSECIEKFASLALKCCMEARESRPSMIEVVRELENIWQSVPEADSTVSESMITDPIGIEMPASLRGSMKNQYLSYDVSGSDVSEVVSCITPR